MFGSFSIGHWLIVLLIVALVFGTRKLRDLGSDLGSAIKGFKEGLQDSEGKRPIQKQKEISKIEMNTERASQTRDPQ